MAYLLVIISLISFVLGIALIIVGKIDKNNYKGGIITIASCVLFVIAFIMIPTQEEAEKNEETETAEAETYSEEQATETDTSTEEESYEEIVEEELELTPQEQMIQNITEIIDSGKAFDAGSYIKGDIPKGEYAFIRYDGSGQYYSEEDQGGNIIDNENFDSFGYVNVHESGNLENQGVLVNTKSLEELGVSGAKELYEIVNDTKDYKDSGWYKIGVDLEPGHYVIESMGEGYVAIMTGPVGNNDIVDNNIFNGSYSVNVQEGQYLVIYRGTITKQ